MFSRNSMPSSLREMYDLCDRPPSLYKFNYFRDDGKDCMQFYTDSNCYFNFWRSDTLKDLEKILHDRDKKVNSIKSRQSSCISLRNIHHTRNTIVDGGHITKTLSMDHTLSNDYTTPFGSNLLCGESPPIVNNNEYNYSTQYSSNYQYAKSTTEVLNPFGNQSRGGKIRPPTPQRFDSLKRTTLSIKNPTGAGHKFNFSRENLPPPPLPPIEDDLYFIKSLPPPPIPAQPPHISPISIIPPLPLANVPPPPPLPPMVNQLETFVNKELNSHSKQNFSSVIQSNPVDSNINKNTFRKTPGINHVANYSTHVDFLSTIKAGVVLRKVKIVEKKETNTVSDDVISILASRIAVEISDSDSSSSKKDDYDSWAEHMENHCSPSVLSDNILPDDRSLSSSHEPLPSPLPSLIENNSFTKPFSPSPLNSSTNIPPPPS